MRTKIMVAVAALSVALMTAGPASAATSISDEQAFGILLKAKSTRTISAADRARLLTRPDIAGRFTDPTRGAVVGETPQVSAAYVDQANLDRYIRYYSYTGGKVLDYHFTVSWRYDGSKITRTFAQGHYIESYTWGIYDRGFTSDTVTYNPGNVSATIRMQAQWEQCILKYGCIAQDDPYYQFGIYGNGYYTYLWRS